MSIFSAFTKKADNIQEALRATDTTSRAMKDSIQECYNLFFEPGKEDARLDNCLRIPALIIDKLTKATFSEYKAVIQDNNEQIEKIMKALDNKKEEIMQALLLGGEVFIKPVIVPGGFDFILVKRDCFMPLRREHTGRITSVGMTETTIDQTYYYTLIEKRTETPKGLLFEYKLYRSHDKDTLGTPVNLAALERYADLQPEILIEGIPGVGMIQVKTPILNNIDGSSDGVCIYSTAAELIKRINLNEAQLNAEFALGQSRIIAPASMFRKDETGKRILYDKIFTTVEGDPEDCPIKIFSPELRQESYLRRKTEYLRNLENTIGLKHGLLADVSMEDKTATEITDSKGDYALTINDLQKTWEKAVYKLLELCKLYADIYNNANIYNYDLKNVVLDFGDGVLYNRDKTAQEMLQMVASGILKAEQYLAWYYDLPCDTPEDAQKIREKYMPESEALFYAGE